MSYKDPTRRSPNKALEVRMSAVGALEGQAKKQLFMDLAKVQGSDASKIVNQLVDYWLGLSEVLPARPESAFHDIEYQARDYLRATGG